MATNLVGTFHVRLAGVAGSLARAAYCCGGQVFGNPGSEGWPHLILRATLVLVTISGIHHLGLTVRDLDSSASWYESVLGFQPKGGFDSADGARRKVFLHHDGMRVRLGLTQHHDHPSGVFDETAVGLDHLAFAVPTRDDLYTWAERLDSHGVLRSPISPANSISGAEVLVFHDPDNIQLELFFAPDAPPGL